MNRRRFLKLATLTSAGTFLALGLQEFSPEWLSFITAETIPVKFGPAGVLYKGTRDGRVLVSKDDGSTWQVATSFGREHAVTRIESRNGELRARLSFRGYPIELKSADGKTWFTADWVAPRRG